MRLGPPQQQLPGAVDAARAGHAPGDDDGNGELDFFEFASMMAASSLPPQKRAPNLKAVAPVTMLYPCSSTLSCPMSVVI